MATTVTVTGVRNLSGGGFAVQFGNSEIEFAGGFAQLLSMLNDFQSLSTLQTILLETARAKNISTAAGLIGHSITWDPAQAANVLVWG